MSSSNTPVFDFKRAVAVQFADRPTLREVVSDALLQVLLAELPWLASVQPTLTSADAITLDSPDPATPYWFTQPLVDCILQALLDTRPLDLEPVAGRHHNLGLLAPYRFAGADSQLDTRPLEGLTDALNELIEQLPRCFCQAQLDYWNAPATAGASRDQWLQLLAKTALLRGLPWQRLDSQEQACLRGLIRAGEDQPPVSLVQVQLVTKAGTSHQMHCSLLVTGEWDERQVILWCAPSGNVRSFTSWAAFSQALRDDLAQRYHFEQMSWQRYPIEGNAFALQSAMLLETLFDRVDQIRYERVADVYALERLFAQVSDPAQWFAGYLDETPAVKAPPGLLGDRARHSSACHAALLQLAVDQLDADGVGAMDGIESLHDFTRRRLSEQMQADHGDATSPDDLLLEFVVARGMPGGAGVGTGGGESLALAGELSLVRFAIGNLGAIRGASIRSIRHASGKAAPSWVDAGAAWRLVGQVDVGRTYPSYVAQRLNDPRQRPQRLGRFAREWRAALRFSALAARLDGKVSDAGLQCVVDFCAGHVDLQAPRMTLAPLAFRRQPQSRDLDPVRGMYLLFCAAPRLVLLYRPLYKQDTLREYTSLEHLLEHLQTSSLLQASVLDWMAPDVRPIYDHGGFHEPHIAFLGIDPYDLPARPGPAVIHPQFWAADVDTKLYDANRDLLVELAGMQSTSNAERRWQTLNEGAWLLFDVVTLALRGPVASVAWVVQLLTSLQSDLAALEQEQAFARSAAIADLLLNLAMVVLHADQPRLQPLALVEPADAAAFEQPAAQHGAFAEVAVQPTMMPAAALGDLAASPRRRLDLSWRGNQGFNWLTARQRQALRAMRVAQPLPASALQTTDDLAGLYQVGGRLYAALDGDAYPVERVAGGVRVVDEQGGQGPWLANVQGVWRVDTALRLSGGMNRSDTRTKLAGRFDNLRLHADKLTVQVNEATASFVAIGNDVTALQGKTTQLISLRTREQTKLATLGEGDERNKTQAIIDRYEARAAEWRAQTLELRGQAIVHLERAVALDDELLSILNVMLEPKFSRARRQSWDAILPKQKRKVQLSFIRNSDFILNELWYLADYSQVAQMQSSLAGQVLGPDFDVYHAFRRKLETVVDLQDRMLTAYEHLDELLLDVPGDLDISLPEETRVRTVDSLIASRVPGTLQFRFHQALSLAELALRLDVVEGQGHLAVYRSELAGLALRSAAEAHGQLDFANLPVEDRISILQEAWDEYAAALLNSARIAKEGGTLIEVSMIERYRLQLEKLKMDAGRRLVEAIRMQEGASVSPRRVPYAVSSEPQRAVRNVAGQILIGNERVIDGQRIVEVREPFNESVLALFDWRDGQWHERRIQPSTSPQPLPVATAARVLALLEENVQMLGKADEYVRNDIKGILLADLFDRQIDKLGRAAMSLGEEGASPALVRSIEAASDHLRSEKNLRLTALYTDTRYPNAEALRFLHEQRLLRVEYVPPRKLMANGSTFDEYKIMRLAQPGATSGRALWVAHFHMASADALARDFTQGHLKTWSQRRLSGREEGGPGYRVHRGKLTLEQAIGIIPFD